jgi:excisionase family DNA binding protein
LKEVALADQFAFSVIEAAAVAGIGRSQVYVAIQSGELKARKRGKSTLILREDLRAWLDALPPYSPSDVSANRYGRPHGRPRRALAAVE